VTAGHEIAGAEPVWRWRRPIRHRVRINKWIDASQRHLL